MKHRTGYLFKRGSNYYVSWRTNGKLAMKALRDENGQPITTKDKAEVARDKFMSPLALADEAESLKAIADRANTIEAKLQENRLADKAPVAFAGAWQAFLNSTERQQKVKASPEVMENYERQLQHFGKWIAAQRPETTALRDVTLDEAQAFRAHLVTSGRSPNTTNKYLSALALIWRALGITDNPWLDTKVGREEKDTADREAFTPAEVKTICEKATGDLQNLFALAAMTGLRLKDCCLLKWQEVNLDAGVIVRVPAKTKRFKNSKVHVPIPPALHRILSGLERDKSGYVLPAMAERYTKAKGELINEIQHHIETCGIATRGEPVADGRRAPTVRGFHSFRHFFVSATLQTGAPMLNVRSMVGHSTDWMTDRYAHVLNDKESRRAVGLLAESIDTNGKTKASPEAILSECRAIVQSMTSRTWKAKQGELLALLAS